MKEDKATICYADKRGIMDKRKVEVQVHLLVYGSMICLSFVSAIFHFKLSTGF